MSLYLVDYENTSMNGLIGIEKLKETDHVTIFYSQNAATMTFEDHVRLTSTLAQVEYVKINKVGKNYLDFQLATYCGYMIGQSNDTEYVIVSKDTGFDSVIDFWMTKKAGVQIRRVNEIVSVILKKKENATNKYTKNKLPETMKKKIRTQIKNEKLTGQSYNQIYTSIMNSSDKQKLHKSICGMFKEERGNHIYKTVLPVYEEYQKGIVKI